MYPQLLQFLACPDQHGCVFTLQETHRVDQDGDVLEGVVQCGRHGTSYQISDGILDIRGWVLPSTAAQLVNDLPPTAWGYERLWRHQALSLLAGEPFGFKRELPLITGLLAPSRPGLYIDVACSNGLYARAIAQARTDAPGHVVGIDHALPMLRQARTFARRAKLRISYVRAEAQALPFANATAAGVAMGGSLNEIGDMAAALAEMRRVVTDGGRVVMMSLVRAESIAGRALQMALSPGGVAFPSLLDHNAMLHAAKLRLVDQWRYRVVVFSLLLAMRERHV